ncbi:MAG: hypothetical protein JSU63_07545 [Phycisphaerales bacterium]|nr:MAG: hypothetical protein JSU63_07545 [Phycisphaerales bacterium]
MKKHNLRYLILFIVVAVLSGELVLDGETPTEKAYRLCQDCDLPKAEVDQLIDDHRHTTLSREQSLSFFDATFKPGVTKGEEYTRCVEAIVHAAGLE